MILHCEVCNCGYHRDLQTCPWCGAGAFLAFLEEPVERVADVECYKDFWCCLFDPPLPGTTGDYQLFEGHPLDIKGLHQILTLSTLITFNGNNYDLPQIALAMAGATNEQLKWGSSMIIEQNLKPWDFYREWNIQEPRWIDTIDMIEVAAGQASLKIYGGKMHSKRVQDLPIHHEASIGLFDRVLLREYCRNDLQTTWDLRRQFDAQIKLRKDMTAEYGIDLRSKSDAQIAEAVMKHLVSPFKRIPKHEVPSGTMFTYQPPAWMKFQHLKVLDLLARSPFRVNAKGGIDMTPELEKTVLMIGRTKYKMGIGGLHSQEEHAVHLADEYYSLRDVDVASYYPTLIEIMNLIPPAIGAPFRDIYLGWKKRRLDAKRAGDKKTADSLKTLLNGTFGKLGSMYSIFYTPQQFIQVTITGQLALLMLIEMLEACQISVVSANTDGLVIKCRRDMEWLRDQCVTWWEQLTGFETEAKDYRALCSRDVNNYIAIPLKGEPKLKGAYARPVPVATSWPNPTGEVCIDALVAFLEHGRPIPDTIRACNDIRRFIHVRKVAGGGEWNGEYLGKAVRWYFSTAPEATSILYKTNGNKVASSDGCRPIMELPDDYAVPNDVDFEKYIADARGMLADLGCQG